MFFRFFHILSILTPFSHNLCYNIYGYIAEIAFDIPFTEFGDLLMNNKRLYVFRDIGLVILLLAVATAIGAAFTFTLPIGGENND